MLNAPSDVEIQPSDISREIPRFVERWPPRTMHSLEVFYPSIGTGLRRTASLGLGTCNVDAVACVFSCPGCVRELGALSRGSLLYGWSAAAIHRTCPRLESGEPLNINERACAATSSLVAMLGLDQRTTRVQELDCPKAVLRVRHAQQNGGPGYSVGGSVSHISLKWRVMRCTRCQRGLTAGTEEFRIEEFQEIN